MTEGWKVGRTEKDRRIDGQKVDVQKDRQADGQKDRSADRQTAGKKDTKTE